MKTKITLLLALALTGCSFTGARVEDEDGSSSDDSSGDAVFTTTPFTTADADSDVGDDSTSGGGEGESSSDGGSSQSSSDGEDSSSTGAPPVNYVLAFEGENQGVTPALPGMPTSYTVEFWLRSGADMHGSLLSTSAGAPTAQGWGFIHDDPPAGGLAFTNVLVYINYDANPAWDYVVDPDLDLREQVGWHHIAITKSIDGLVRMWVDGGMVVEQQFGAPFAVSERPLTIGPNLHDAMIDDVRISDAVRYEALFEPPEDMSVDADTLYLWRFNEGEGTEAVDEVEGVAFELNDPIWVER
jgi:hypothetical protein